MPRSRFTFKARDKQLLLGKKTSLMGIINMTPDSFSDGGQYNSLDLAVERCLSMVEAGADIIDIGGESSRPGSLAVSAAEEIERILPLLEKIRHETNIIISIDTCKSEVADSVLAAGADIINDISALKHSPGMAETISRWNAGAILMHMRGEPSSMHLLEPSKDIMSEIIEDLKISVDKAVRSNVSRDRIIIDPGIGFGKNNQENLLLLNRLPLLEKLELPVMIGASRKRFIGAILDKPVSQRIYGTIASSVVAIMKGVHILRVHDVAEIKEAAEVSDAIARESLNK
jgi:dihydropteroate synthase